MRDESIGQNYFGKYGKVLQFDLLGFIDCILPYYARLG